MATNCFEQIEARLERYYLVRSLKKRRNQLINQRNVIIEKFRSLESSCFETKANVENQAQALNLSLEIFDEVEMSQQQLDFLASVAEKDDYLSELFQLYERELVEIDIQLITLESNCIESNSVSVAA
jgi:hypothetical protein